MKKLFVFIPAILLVLFLLNSFVLKEKKTGEKPTGTKSENLSIILQSADGGQTWQDISKGLPKRLQREGVGRDNFFANDRGLFLRSGNGIYHTEPNSATPYWTTDIFPGERSYMSPGNNGIYVYNFRGQFLKKINGATNWLPVYTNFQEQAVRINSTMDWMYEHFKEKGVCAFFETVGGTAFISSNNSIFRSANSGKTWKLVHAGDGVMRLTESNGVLLATSNEGILRSVDDGQNWYRVINEGGTGIAVERIDGGFAAIVNNLVTKTNTIHISTNGGKTWNTIGEELQPSWMSLWINKISGHPSLNILSIKQAGKYLICSRSDGIFRSADMGKTWKQILPSTGNLGFSLSASGNVIYAIPNKGC